MERTNKHLELLPISKHIEKQFRWRILDPALDRVRRSNSTLAYYQDILYVLPLSVLPSAVITYSCPLWMKTVLSSWRHHHCRSDVGQGNRMSFNISNWKSKFTSPHLLVISTNYQISGFKHHLILLEASGYAYQPVLTCTLNEYRE